MSATVLSRFPVRVLPSRAELAPWRDPAGRLSLLKLATLLGILAPAGWLLLRWAGGDLGSRPITEALHVLGDWAVRFLLLALAVTPARAVLDWPRVVLLRRMLGVAAALYALAHLTLYGFDQAWQVGKIAREIALRFYLTIGFAALLMLLVLAATSTDGWQKRLRQRWKALHRLVWVLLPLALWHYFLQSKSDVSDAVLFAGFAIWLALWRLAPRRWQGRALLLPPLALAAGLLAAGLEAGWYGLASRVPASRVLAANLDLAFGPRPAVWVALAGLAVFALALLRRLLPSRRGPSRRPGRADAALRRGGA